MRASRQWLDETRANENDERDECGREAVDAERINDEHLYECEIERRDDTDKRNALQCAAQELIENDKLERRKHEEDAVKDDAVLGDRHTEQIRVRARHDDIAAREIVDIADKRRATCLMLGDIRGIREPEERES